MDDFLQRYTYIFKDVGKKYMNSFLQWFNNNKWIGLLALLVLYVVVMSKKNSKLVQLKGKEAQGRNYAIQYIFDKKTNYQKEIDTLLDKIEKALNIDNPDSEVANFNYHNSEPFYYQTPFLYPLLVKSKEVYNQTQGAFDPTVAPLLKLWKQSLRMGTRPTDLAIESLRPYVGLDYIVVNEERAKKLKEEVNINLNSLIPSYEVDAIANLLKSHKVQDFYIQLGNETLVRGTNARKKPWKIVQKIATEQPTEKILDVHINLQNKAISIIKNHTSQKEGSYQLDVVIDPLTGNLALNNFIAAFVFAEDCISARTYATAFMAKSFLTASSIVERLGDIDFFIIYKDEAGASRFRYSTGLQVDHQEGSNKVFIQKLDTKSPSTGYTYSTKKGERD